MKLDNVQEWLEEFLEPYQEFTYPSKEYTAEIFYKIWKMLLRNKAEYVQVAQNQLDTNGVYVSKALKFLVKEKLLKRRTTSRPFNYGLGSKFSAELVPDTEITLYICHSPVATSSNITKKKKASKELTGGVALSFADPGDSLGEAINIANEIQGDLDVIGTADVRAYYFAADLYKIMAEMCLIKRLNIQDQDTTDATESLIQTIEKFQTDLRMMENRRLITLTYSLLAALSSILI